MFVDVDRDKAQMLKVPVDRIFEALRVYMGSAYVNDFNMFGRTYRVTAQAGGDFRMDPENVNKIRVRNIDGAMVPLGSLVRFREQAGPDRVPRYNLFPTVEIQGSAKPGRVVGRDARASWRRSRRRFCPMASATSGPTCRIRRRRSAAPATSSSLLSVLFVFLALAAQYESWSLPLAIMLIVPMCLLSAAFGVWLHGRDINILTQIGFVVLIGLGGQERDPDRRIRQAEGGGGPRHRHAAVEASRQRLRPILMTSLAFTLGVIPLYIAPGAGAELRVALGTAVFWGMIGVTLFGLIFTPVFYVVIRKLVSRRKTKGEGTAPTAGTTAHGASPVPAE